MIALIITQPVSPGIRLAVLIEYNCEGYSDLGVQVDDRIDGGGGGGILYPV